MKSIDANIVLRFILRDVPAQTLKVTNLLKEAPPGSLVISDVVFAEVVWVLGGPFLNLDRQLIGYLLL